MTPSKGPTVAVSTPQTATVVIVADSYRYEAVFSAPASEWHVVHNLGARPNVTVLDAQGNAVGVNVDHLDENTVHIIWNSPQTGRVICS